MAVRFQQNCHQLIRAKNSGCFGLFLRNSSNSQFNTTEFPREIESEKRAQKFHADDVSLPRSG